MAPGRVAADYLYKGRKGLRAERTETVSGDVVKKV